MPLPSLLCFAFAAGTAAALAGRVELRVNPRPAIFTRSFGGFLIFELFVLVPVSVYFYMFHGDWFLLYLLDVSVVPSALALIGFLVEAAFGAVGFLAGASLVRHQRDGLAMGVTFGALASAGLVAFAAKDRLAQVGTFGQFHAARPYGLKPFESGPIFQGGLAMGAILLLALLALLYRLRTSTRR
ncbi:MAG: hypothetical protein AAF411_10065 [Myxococcota bacterium]